MSDLFRRAESILEAASARNASSADTAIVLDRAGGMRILSSEGWTLAGIIREFGAAEVYMVRNCAATTTVEGWSTMDHCTISRKLSRSAQGYAATLQVTPQLLN